MKGQPPRRPLKGDASRPSTTAPCRKNKPRSPPPVQDSRRFCVVSVAFARRGMSGLPPPRAAIDYRALTARSAGARMDGDVGGYRYLLKAGPHDLAYIPARAPRPAIRDKPDGRYMCQRSREPHRQAPLDPHCLNIGEPLRPVEFRYPGHCMSCPGGVLKRETEPRRCPRRRPGRANSCLHSRVSQRAVPPHRTSKHATRSTAQPCATHHRPSGFVQCSAAAHKPAPSLSPGRKSSRTRLAGLDVWLALA